MRHFLFPSLFVCALLAGPAAFAQTNNSQPIEITAGKSVEWLRNDNQYVARENVIVTQGTMQILTDLLTADYRDSAQSSMEIWQITAEGNVQIKDEQNTAYGDKGVYDVTNGVAVLTGGDLKLVSPDQTVTATDRMEYHANERMAKAVGNAKVVRAKDTLAANTITAYFKDGGTASPAEQASSNPVGGGGSLDRLEADGNVIITTPTEILRGSKAVYKADTNTAEITGKVKVERGENVLEGERAEVNLTTNVSKMFGSSKEGGRVRGVFFPGSNNGNIKGQGGAATPAPAPAPTPAPAVQPSLPAPAPAPAAAPSQSTNSSGALPPPAAKVSPKVEY